jgi:hypothetical protein
MKHSPEPWVIDDPNDTLVAILDADGTYLYIAEFGWDSNEYHTDPDTDILNAARTVACVNALAGVEDPDGFMKEIRDMLPAVAARCEEREEDDMPCDLCGTSDCGFHRIALMMAKEKGK